MLDSEISKNNQAAFEKDSAGILEALRKGKCFVANFNNGNARGFRFYAEFRGITCNMGDTISANGENVILRALVPKECEIRLIHNGNLFSESKGMNAAWDVNLPGIYRVECWTASRGWIFSNHIRII